MTVPMRIQRKRTKGWRMPENTKSVTRPGKWGNPHVVRKFINSFGHVRYMATHKLLKVGNTGGWSSAREAARHAVWVQYQYYIQYEIILGNLSIKELSGFNLACFCPLCEKHKDGRPWNEPCDDCPPCHADVLLELANA
jgi:Domain of unknown function (DUF4326)